MMEGPGAESEEKREPARRHRNCSGGQSEVLDPDRPIREADLMRTSRQGSFVPLAAVSNRSKAGLFDHFAASASMSASASILSGIVSHYDGDGAIIYKHACALGCEGTVSKRLGSPYRAGCSAHWRMVQAEIERVARGR